MENNKQLKEVFYEPFEEYFFAGWNLESVFVH
jgi:hypothetical protein